MRIYLTNGNPPLVAELKGRYYRLPALDLPDLVHADDLARQLQHFIKVSGDQAHPSAVDEANVIARSSTRRCGRPGSPTCGARSRGWRSRRTPAAAASTTASTRPTGPR